MDTQRKELMSEIQHFDEGSLKHTLTIDKSVPSIDDNMHLKKVDRTPFLKEVKEGTQLKEPDVMMDRSAPRIDMDAHVKKHDRRYPFLSEVEAKGVSKRR